MKLAIHALTIITLLGTLFSMLCPKVWWVKVCDVGRAHTGFFMAALMIAIMLVFPLSEWWAITYLLLLFGGIIYHFSIVYPFSPFHKVELETTLRDDRTLKILTANVRMKNKQYHRLTRLIEQENPDVFLLTEVDQGWVDAVISLKEKYPYTVLQPQQNTYGIVLFSKYQLDNTEVKFLVEKDIPSIHTNIKFKGKNIQFLGLHPRPPAPWTSPERKDLELIKVAGMANHNNLPTIVGGDLNDVGWSKVTQTFKYISGLLDPRVGRGFFSTYNALIPFFQVPIDHFFVSKHFKLVNICRLGRIGSDHFPVMLEVNLEDNSSKINVH